jgi:hypothetical protein
MHRRRIRVECENRVHHHVPAGPLEAQTNGVDLEGELAVLDVSGECGPKRDVAGPGPVRPAGAIQATSYRDEPKGGCKR